MKHLFVKILYLSFLFFPACGIWEDFTTYFNLYYNTKDIFELAEEAIYQQERGIFETAEIIVPGSASQQLTRVIEKTSKILQFHGTTSYVDDALMMAGKSFYYQKNYLKAIRKFQELTATQQESDYYLEAELWTAKTQMRMREFENALNALDTLIIKAASEENEDILTEAYIEKIIYYVSRENYSEAIRTAEELIPASEDDVQKAEIIYETGNFYLKLDDPQNAIRYFEMVEEYSPEYNVQLNALLARGRTLRLLERNNEALNIFKEMRLEDKYRDEFDILDYEIGMTYLELDQLNEAVENLQYADTSYTTSPYSGLARYNLGLIYENNFLNYDSAYTYYQKAAASQLPQEKVKEVHYRNQLFKKYMEISGKITQTRTQIFYVENPDAFVKDSTAYFDSIKALAQQDSLIDGGDERSTGRTGGTPEQRFPVQNVSTQTGNSPTRPTVSKDSLEKILLKEKFNIANLFFAELEKPDSAAKYYMEILNDTSGTEYYSRSLYTLGNYYLSSGDSVKADSIFNYIYENYKNDKIVNAAAHQLKKPLIDISFDPAEEIFTEAEKLWMDQKYDSALAIYNRIYTDYPASPFAPKALAAEGWILENDLKLLDSAASVYDMIAVKYAGSIYAQKTSPKLIAYKQEQARIQRQIEDSLRVIQMKEDSLKKEIIAVTPDSLSEVERLKLEMEKNLENLPEIETAPDSLKTEERKPETLQPPPTQTNERRNPRRRR